MGDPWSASTLLRAADLLRVPVRAVRRPGGQLLTVDGRPALDALVHVVSGGALTGGTGPAGMGTGGTVTGGTVTGGTGAPVAARARLVG
ncbi:hypothetical protein [Cryptosporangium minutisporangium]|uniref:hypothetical protein n=1 Tax=Cryptosporangium minutisporangium TaxID=113569 RepID=UPI0035EE5FBF